MTQRQQIGNGLGRIVTVTVTSAGDGVNNAGNGIGNGSTGGGSGKIGSGVGGGSGSVSGNAIGSGVSVAAYQNANMMQAAPAWAFQLLPSLYNHYQKVLQTSNPPPPSE
jgi:L-aminopeptidase/D-esterase-like protein